MNLSSTLLSMNLTMS